MIIAIDVQKIGLIPDGDRQIEFLLLDGKDQIDGCRGMGVADGMDDDLG